MHQIADRAFHLLAQCLFPLASGFQDLIQRHDLRLKLAQERIRVGVKGIGPPPVHKRGNGFIHPLHGLIHLPPDSGEGEGAQTYAERCPDEQEPPSQLPEDCRRQQKPRTHQQERRPEQADAFL